MGEGEVELTFAGLAAMTAEAQGDRPPGSAGWTAEDSPTARINEAMIRTLREHGGRVPGELEDVPFLLLTMTGARTGLQRTRPLLASVIEGRLLVVASLGGAGHNPPWFHNVVADPEVTVEWRGDTFPARAVVHEGDERARLFGAVAGLNPVFADYQRRTTRLLPVVELVPLDGRAIGDDAARQVGIRPSDGGRAEAFDAG
jgi:deazaflavin-dependent oxidoreductase (nitroreductase family)